MQDKLTIAGYAAMLVVVVLGQFARRSNERYAGSIQT